MAIVRQRLLFAQQRPAAGGGAGGALAGGLRCGCLAARIHQRAELIESVGSGQAGGGELPQRVRVSAGG